VQRVHHYTHWSGLLEIAALTLAMTSLIFWMGTSHVVQKRVFASEARQSRSAARTSLRALERSAGDCRADARNDVVETRLFWMGTSQVVQKRVFASEARQSHGAARTSLRALDRSAGDCRADARNDVVKNVYFCIVNP
jgi:hypothetical protein